MEVSGVGSHLFEDTKDIKDRVPHSCHRADSNPLTRSYSKGFAQHTTCESARFELCLISRTPSVHDSHPDLSEVFRFA